jgi:tetratricopeptide (TPR) repeat protein
VLDIRTELLIVLGGNVHSPLFPRFAVPAIAEMRELRRPAAVRSKLPEKVLCMPLSDITESSERAGAVLELPNAPASETGPVKVWEQPVVLRTYRPAAPDRNPLFLEKRVYQGSSGRVYPLPVIDRIDTEPRDVQWKAVHLENEFVRFMVLPEIGGRIHVGLDKLNQYDFFYRQNVIKPALVGLAGPWISGGVEFNWPQHHRPATFMPVEVEIERADDGSVTVWCGDHDPMSHLKGMHGLCVRPGRAYLELRVRLYNRTADTQTFLWWANVATRVHEKYQSFFPKDVQFVADHAKRAVTEFPLSHGKYYGVDYEERAMHGVPAEEMPARFIPDGSYAANDLSWYANIPVPTSYMIANSRGDFAGGYDHKCEAGMVHVANHHIAPGKKQWTWGNHEFGYAWDRSLTDSDGPYIELMAGVYTDNQPDFSFLAPGETKTFSQFWYPIREIGVPDLANLEAAIRVERKSNQAIIHLQPTGEYPHSTVRVLIDGKEVDRWQGDLLTGKPLHYACAIPSIGAIEIVVEHAGSALLRYAPSEIIAAEKPEVATEPPLPEDVETADELFLIGLHLEQYRHPTRSPDVYWREAIRRDPGDSRANHALGRWYLRRGELSMAEKYLRTAIGRLTARNPNPYDGEPHYNLGLALLYQGRSSDAYAAFYKSTWNAAWRGPAYHRLAEIDCVNHEWSKALDHIDRSLRADLDNLNARSLKVIVLRRLGRAMEAEGLLEETRTLDPLDIFTRFLSSNPLPANGQQILDLVFDLLRAGLNQEAADVVSTAPTDQNDGSAAMLLYAKGQILSKLGRQKESVRVFHEAAAAKSDYVFPNRVEEMLLLEEVMRNYPQDARAPFYLGNALYDRRRHREAIELWEHAARLDPSLPTVWRNLGFGYYNVLHEAEKARSSFEQARIADPEDARILYEQDQLLKRTGETLERRLAMLESHRYLVETRDDLSIELASLYNSVGAPALALKIILGRHFQPWEGGEGQVLAQFVRANLLLGQEALRQGNAREAAEFFERAWNPPQHISEACHLLMNRSAINYWLGVAYRENGFDDRSTAHFERAARNQADFQQMQIQPISEMTYWSAQALAALDKMNESRALFEEIHEYATQLASRVARIDYFATSLPAMLLFEEDLVERQDITVLFLKAQALLGLGNAEEGGSLLNEVLGRDRNHTGAVDLRRWLEG